MCSGGHVECDFHADKRLWIATASWQANRFVHLHDAEAMLVSATQVCSFSQHCALVESIGDAIADSG